MKQLDVVTGSFGYSGRYITRLLLKKGHAVRSLTNSIQRINEFGNQIEAHPFHFDNPEQLVSSLKGCHTLYNTYWVRFNAREFQHAQAVKNTKILFQAAREAGIKRIVHTSISNPDKHSSLEYFQGKGELEEALKNLGVAYSILRPAVLFGGEDILIQNMAWMIRHLPLIPLFGWGDYKLQPIHVEDFATLAVQEAAATGNRIIEAIGPETYSFKELLQEINAAIGLKRLFIPAPPSLVWLGTFLLGQIFQDKIITREEIKGLMANTLYTPGAPPAGKTSLKKWLFTHKNHLGIHYQSEMARRRNRKIIYSGLELENHAKST